jgi:hypothetical protein
MLSSNVANEKKAESLSLTIPAASNARMKNSVHHQNSESDARSTQSD